MEPELDDIERGGARDPDRPELARLMQAVRDRQVDVVVIHDDGSLSGDAAKALEVPQELTRLGIGIRFVSPAQLDGEKEE